MRLLIDDQRDLGCDVIARTAEAGKKLIPIHPWEFICFDHDLGCVESGYDVLKWALEGNLIRRHIKIQLVTSNPVGRKNMHDLLVSYNFQTNEGINFYKAA